MRLKDYKLEFFFVSTLITTIIGVIIWYVLDYFLLNNSIEIAVIFTITIIMVFISYLLHGKGLLPDPNTSLKTKTLSKNYTRKKIRLKKFARDKYLTFSPKKKEFNKFYRK